MRNTGLSFLALLALALGHFCRGLGRRALHPEIAKRTHHRHRRCVKKVIPAPPSKLLALMLRHHRRYLALPYTVLAGALALGALAQGPPPPGPGAAAAARPEMGDFSSRGAEWAWIVTTGEQSELLSGGPGTAGRTIAKGSGWTDVAVGADGIWLLQSEGSRSRLLLAPKGGGEPREVLASTESSAALFALDEQVFWLELTPAKVAGVSYVPTLGGTLRLRRCDAAGKAGTLAEWPAGGRVDRRGVEIIGSAGGRIYVADFNGIGTEFQSVPLAGGVPVRVAAESDSQHGVLHGGRLVWTAPSEEATPSSRIRRLLTRKDDAEPEVLADWVPAIGNLLSVGDRLYYAGAGSVYRAPGASEPPVFTGRIAFGPVATDGKTLIELSSAAPVAQAP